MTKCFYLAKEFNSTIDCPELAVTFVYINSDLPLMGYAKVRAACANHKKQLLTEHSPWSELEYA